MARYKNIIGSLLVAFGLFLFWTWILPNYDAISSFKPVIEAKELKLVEREQIVNRLRALSQEYDLRQEGITRLNYIVPLDKSQASIVASLEDISSRSGMLLSKISLSESGEGHGVLISLELNGSYLSFVNFLQQIEKNIRLMDVNSFDVASSEDPNSNLLSFKVKINTYFLE
jgi:Tfp pilus assembly protein PilO